METWRSDATGASIPGGEEIAMPIGTGYQVAKYRVKLFGAFVLTAPDGRRLPVTSKKGVAMLGLLATARGGERWRSWIQEKLWGSRELPQAQSSLRRELHEIRTIGNDVGVPLIEANRRVVRLVLDNVDVDVRSNPESLLRNQEFLEGINVVGEEGFEEWLDIARGKFRRLRSVGGGASMAVATSYIPFATVISSFSV